MANDQIPLSQDTDVAFITEVSNIQRNIDHLTVKRYGHKARTNFHEFTRSQSAGGGGYKKTPTTRVGVFTCSKSSASDDQK